MNAPRDGPGPAATGRKPQIEEAFYRECARLLQATHAYKPWIGPPPNRWNNRHPGNGRFPGYGTIRMHAPDQIHVSLRHPVRVTRTCRSPEEVFRLLQGSMRSAGIERRPLKGLPAYGARSRPASQDSFSTLLNSSRST